MGSFWFWTVLVLGIILGPILLMVVIGLFLPKAHTAERTAEFATSPEALWQVITDVEQAPAWRRGVKSVERLPDRNGKPAWKEVNAHGGLPFSVEVTEPPRKYVTRIIDDGMPFGGTWTYTLEPKTGGGSTLTIREDGLVHNPLFRFLSRFLFGHHATMDGYLEDLRQQQAGAAA